MTVIMPPKMVTKDKGISNLEGDIPRLRHQSSTIGKNIATTAVLLINPDIGPTKSPITTI